MRHCSNCRMGWRPPPRQYMCLLKARLFGELSPKGPENTPSMFKLPTELSRNVLSLGQAWSVCRQSVFAGNSGSVLLCPEDPLCPRTIRSSQSPCSILSGTSLSLVSNGTGCGCSLVCLWLQVFSSRVFLESKYEVETNNFSTCA